jgi:ATP-dependent Lon protease
MATSLTSMLTGRKVRADTAMTGELTLVGEVLPIGGLKEKALAAQQAGIKRVIAPSLNAPDIDDIPNHLRKEIEFLFVDTIDKALREALEPGPNGAKAAAASGSRTRKRSSSNGGSGNSRPSKPARSRTARSESRR